MDPRGQGPLPVTILPERHPLEWPDLMRPAADDLVRLSNAAGLAQVEVTEAGRWLIRTEAAVFDQEQ